MTKNKLMFDIEIHYQTGNSFNTEELTEMLGNPVSSIEDAKTNLKRIKENYKKNRDAPNYAKEYDIVLATDNGERKITPFWIGYFEKLISAKIVLDEGMKDIEFETWGLEWEDED